MLSVTSATTIHPTAKEVFEMTTPTPDMVVLALVVQTCPLCGEVLDPASDHVLCPECELDQAEKWADYCAEREQAWRP